MLLATLQTLHNVLRRVASQRTLSWRRVGVGPLATVDGMRSQVGGGGHRGKATGQLPPVAVLAAVVVSKTELDAASATDKSLLLLHRLTMLRTARRKEWRTTLCCVGCYVGQHCSSVILSRPPLACSAEMSRPLRRSLRLALRGDRRPSVMLLVALSLC